MHLMTELASISKEEPNDSHLHSVFVTDWFVYSCFIFKVSETGTKQGQLPNPRMKMRTRQRRWKNSQQQGYLNAWFLFTEQLCPFRMFNWRIGTNIHVIFRKNPKLTCLYVIWHMCHMFWLTFMIQLVKGYFLENHAWQRIQKTLLFS